MSGSNNIVRFQQTNREAEITNLKTRSSLFENLGDLLLVTNQGTYQASNLFFNTLLPVNTPLALTPGFQLSDVKTLLNQNYINKPSSAWSATITNFSTSQVGISYPTGFKPQTVDVPGSSMIRLLYVCNYDGTISIYVFGLASPSTSPSQTANVLLQTMTLSITPSSPQVQYVVYPNQPVQFNTATSYGDQSYLTAYNTVPSIFPQKIYTAIQVNMWNVNMVYKIWYSLIPSIAPNGGNTATITTSVDYGTPQVTNYTDIPDSYATITLFGSSDIRTANGRAVFTSQVSPQSFGLFINQQTSAPQFVYATLNVEAWYYPNK